MWSYRLPKFEAIRGVTHDRLILLEVYLNPKHVSFNPFKKNTYQNSRFFDTCHVYNVHNIFFIN